MDPTAAAASRGRTLAELRRFHWAGELPEGRREPPATSHPYLEAAELASPYPLLVEPGEDGSPRCRPLAELGDPAPSEGGDPPLPEGGRIVQAADEAAAIHLFAAAVESRVGAARASFSRTVDELAGSLRALLEVDQRRRRKTDDPVAELGKLGARFLDPAALAGTLPGGDAGPGLGEVRQRRIRGALDGLAAWASIAGEPALTVVHGGSAAPGGDGASWRTVHGEDPCAVARELFDRAAGRLAEVLRAVRLARLELAGDYDPPRHDPWLEELDWQAFDRRELMLLPRVLACLDADDLGACWLSLSRLLLSGRPVQVLVAIDPSAYPGAEDRSDPLAEYRLEPAFLGLGFREALVQQGTPARPDLLLRGFARAVGATRAGLHVIARSAAGDGANRRQAAAVAARAHPLFLYDPGAGSGWARRIELSGNPRPDLDWPAYELGTPPSSATFSFADFASLEAAFAGHFVVVRDPAPEEDLVPVDTWLTLSEVEAAAKLPYVWRSASGGQPCKAVITRRLALACRDRLDFWRTLQELAGGRGEPAEPAGETPAREIDRLKAEHAAELERVRAETAGRTVERLLTSLLGDEIAPPDLSPQGSTRSTRA